MSSKEVERVLEFVDKTDKAIRGLLKGKGTDNPDDIVMSLASEAFIDYDCATFIAELLKTKFGGSYDTVKLMSNKFNKKALVNTSTWHKISKAVRYSNLSGIKKYLEDRLKPNK